MDLFNQELMYEFHAKDLLQTGALRQYADHAVKEIKSTIGWDADVQVNIEPVKKGKHLFSVCMGVFGKGESIVVRKDGKDILAVLRKVRKSVLRQLHRINERKLSYRRKHVFRHQQTA